MAGDAAAAAAAALSPCRSSPSRWRSILLPWLAWWVTILSVFWVTVWLAPNDPEVIVYGSCNVLSVDTTTATVLASLATVAADFGPPVPQEGGVRGVLLRLAPERDGCSLAYADKDGGDDPAWIALMERGNCSFHDKVLHAQLAGAVAAIVFNNEIDQDLMTMSAQNANDIRIPSVLISKQDGYLLRLSLLVREQEHEECVTVLLEPGKDGSDDPTILALFCGWVAAHAIFTAIGVGWSLFYGTVVTSQDGDEEAVVGVKCEAVAPPVLIDVMSDGNSKVEEGQRKVEEAETQHLMRDYKHKEKVDTPPMYYP
eukprot:jgi/Chlat1/6075/Chrsp4S06223